jgi:uncharacterized protein YutE (UPF0331/DUF86 family)
VSEETAAQKVTAIQRCVSQARKALTDAGDEFRTSYLHQDAAVLNIIRACETSIDLANMLIRLKRLGIPAESRESFSILVREKLIGLEFGKRLERMVGFRNLAVHRYQELNLDIVEAVIRENLDDLLAFARAVYPSLSASD